MHQYDINVVTGKMAHMTSKPRKSVRTSVLLPEDIYAQVQALADENHVSTAWVIRQAVTDFLRTHQDQTELPLRLTESRKRAR